MSDPVLHALRACVVRGEHRLSAGAETGVYVDARRAILGRNAEMFVNRMKDEVWRAKGDLLPDGEDLVIAGPVLSGAIIASGIGRLFWIGGALAVRSAAKGHGTERRVEGPDTAPGMAAWLVDDVLTTGASLRSAAEALEQERGLKVIGATVLVQRGKVDLPFTVTALYQMEELL